jgi:signal transduction histidine kinase
LAERKEIDIKYQQTYNQSEFYRDLLSHDINNILQVILSTAEHVERVEIEENLEVIGTAVTNIKKQIERGSSLISTIYKISQIENGKVPLDSIEVMEPLNKAIKSTIGSFGSRKIKIEIECNLNDLYGQANSILLDVFENLLHNAVKHNQSSIVEILIRISRQVKGEINYLKLEFIDNGLGIPDEMKELIFQKKYRAGELKAGMGLGLSLVKNAIDSYGGEISIEDRVPGDYSQGSNFIILIPESI